jgi:methylenetetrahydrofolate reductase (NADPH)
MSGKSKLAAQLESGRLTITAELLAAPVTEAGELEKVARLFDPRVTAVNVADNPHGVATSSLAVSATLARLGVEPVLQIVTRDRNRIALQSDLVGARLLGIANVLCLSGHHQTLTDQPQSANVFDLDSVQLVALVSGMREQGALPGGAPIAGGFAMTAGAAANPYLQPMELNLIRLRKKVAAGARFIQTGAVFDVAGFKQWLTAAHEAGLCDKTAILAGILPIAGAREATALADKYTDLRIPPSVIERLKAAGDEAAQHREGLKICAEIVGEIKSLAGLRGLHILSGGKESCVRELLDQAAL